MTLGRMSRKVCGTPGSLTAAACSIESGAYRWGPSMSGSTRRTVIRTCSPCARPGHSKWRTCAEHALTAPAVRVVARLDALPSSCPNVRRVATMRSQCPQGQVAHRGRPLPLALIYTGCHDTAASSRGPSPYRTRIIRRARVGSIARCVHRPVIRQAAGYERPDYRCVAQQGQNHRRDLRGESLLRQSVRQFPWRTWAR